jgi:hypothetical protein
MLGRPEEAAARGAAGRPGIRWVVPALPHRRHPDDDDRVEGAPFGGGTRRGEERGGSPRVRAAVTANAVCGQMVRAVHCARRLRSALGGVQRSLKAEPVSTTVPASPRSRWPPRSGQPAARPRPAVCGSGRAPVGWPPPEHRAGPLLLDVHRGSGPWCRWDPQPEASCASGKGSWRRASRVPAPALRERGTAEASRGPNHDLRCGHPGNALAVIGPVAVRPRAPKAPPRSEGAVQVLGKRGAFIIARLSCLCSRSSWPIWRNRSARVRWLP